MHTAPISIAVVLCACLGAFLLSNPSAIAQDTSGPKTRLDGVTEATLVLANGTKESGKVRLVMMGGEPSCMSTEPPPPAT